jgi:hypothetical protein
MTRIVTITDDNSVILYQFVVSNKDALKISEDYDTSWMDDDEFKDYMNGGE